jgi:hypothetical protein
MENKTLPRGCSIVNVYTDFSLGLFWLAAFCITRVKSNVSLRGNTCSLLQYSGCVEFIICFPDINEVW